MATSQRTRRKAPTPADTLAAAPVTAADGASAAAPTPTAALVALSADLPDAVASVPRGRARKPKVAPVALQPVEPAAALAVADPVDKPAAVAVSQPLDLPIAPATRRAASSPRGGRGRVSKAPVEGAPPTPADTVPPAPAAAGLARPTPTKPAPATTARAKAPQGKKAAAPAAGTASRPARQARPNRAVEPAAQVSAAPAAAVPVVLADPVAAAPVAAAAPAPGVPTDDTVQAVLAVLASTPAAPPVKPQPSVASAPRSAEPPPAPAAEPPPEAPADGAPRAPRAAPAPAFAPTPASRAARPATTAIEPAAEPPTGPAHSAIVLLGGDRRQVAWQPGHACPPALRQAARQRLDDAGHLAPDDDAALPTLLRLAAEAHHPLRVDEAVWAHLAAHRDARTRLHTLEAAYPAGPADAALGGLLRSPLPLFQAEGALFAVVAGRALIADERGLGKGVQAIAAACLWQRHFGVQRVLVLCAADQRAAWRRAWVRFAGAADVEPPQLMDGGLHQRQALWSTTAGVRILSPEALDSDAAHLAQWAPDLVIVDEPQRLGLRDGDWSQLVAPQALVLCGAALVEQPALMQSIVGWLDHQRLGPLAALHELQAAADAGQGLGDADIERLTAQLSRLMLQRLRADVADQLPPLVHTERLLAMAPGQREAHDRGLAQACRIADGWQRSGYLSDADQWTLSVALREMQRAAHRADPADAQSALADSTVQALAAQLADWADGADTGAPRVAVLCPDEADLAPLARRLAERGALAATDAAGQPLVQLVAPGAPLPAAVDAVLQVGVPWRPRRSAAGARGEAPAGQQWVYLVAQGSLDTGLFDTLAQRHDAPRGLADGGGRAYLQGERLADWMRAVQAALVATAAGR